MGTGGREELVGAKNRRADAAPLATRISMRHLLKDSEPSGFLLETKARAVRLISGHAQCL
jgi:hypothetical protein